MLTLVQVKEEDEEEVICIKEEQEEEGDPLLLDYQMQQSLMTKSEVRLLHVHATRQITVVQRYWDNKYTVFCCSFRLKVQ